MFLTTWNNYYNSKNQWNEIKFIPMRTPKYMIHDNCNEKIILPNFYFLGVVKSSIRSIFCSEWWVCTIIQGYRINYNFATTRMRLKDIWYAAISLWYILCYWQQIKITCCAICIICVSEKNLCSCSVVSLWRTSGKNSHFSFFNVERPYLLHCKGPRREYF